MSVSGNPVADLALAREAVLEAGAEVRSRFGAAADVRYKSRDQPVTEADLIADRLLHSRLLAEREDYGWLSEETADSPDRLERRRVWVVDPIDGTNAFIAGLPEFVVSVGLVEDGVPIVGVVYNPITAELYEAVRGAGATLNGEPIEVSESPDEDPRPVLLSSRWELEAGVMRRYEARWRLRALGSTAYRMVKVAEGDAQGFLSPAWKNEWDVCGAGLVVAEAGGRVRRGDGAELLYNRPEPSFRGIVVWSGRVTPPHLP